MWTVVLDAADSGSPEAASSLEHLCRTYWPPLYSYAFSKLRDSHEAEDVTQAFFQQLLERKDIRDLSPDRGRFRAFLLAAMKNFLGKHWARKNALKRGGDRRIVSFDELTEGARQALESATGEASDRDFDARWARTLVNHVFTQMEAEFARQGNVQRYRQLSRFVLGEIDDQAYAETAQALGLTESAVRSAVMRIRRRFRTLFRETVLNSVERAEDVEDEMRHLLAAIS